MEYRQEYEQEIDLRDLVFHVLDKWRSVFLTAIVLCALAGSYAAIRNLLSIPEETVNVWEHLWKSEDINLTKYFVAGFGAGLFIAIFCRIVAYTYSDKIRGERELRERYGYRLLGIFPSQRKKRIFSGIDRLVRKLEGGSVHVTEEQAYRIISANITNLAREGGTFLVTGTVHIGKLQEFTHKIVSQLQENIILVTGSYMSEAAETLEMLAECDAVILIEERDKSLRRKIQSEQDSISALNKDVIGYVLL